MASTESQETPLSPTQVAEFIERKFFSGVGKIRVDGEVSGAYKGSRMGTYFNLKDDKNLIKAVLWANKTVLYDALIDNGAQLIVDGYLRCYAPRSEYQISVDRVTPKGEGNLKKAYDLLKKKLEKEGLFDKERKRHIPAFPRKVALLTSESGAALSDFLGTAYRRYPIAKISLYPVKVQGSEAAQDMASAIAALNLWGKHDLIVLTRGGGSFEDLWAFNEEILIRAVATSRIPTFAAIGHSVNLSLTELTADGKAITPTAAAETIFPDRELVLKELRSLQQRMTTTFQNCIRKNEEKFFKLYDKIRTFPLRLNEKSRLIFSYQKLLRLAGDNILERLSLTLEGLKDKLRILSPDKELKRREKELESLKEALREIGKRLVFPHQKELAHAVASLELVSPLRVLSRGYSLAMTLDGKVIRSSSELSPGDRFSLRFGKGNLVAAVESVEEGGDEMEKP
jgi:exodeoxyribonuclease VII large subunit